MHRWIKLRWRGLVLNRRSISLEPLHRVQRLASNLDETGAVRGDRNNNGEFSSVARFGGWFLSGGGTMAVAPSSDAAHSSAVGGGLGSGHRFQLASSGGLALQVVRSVGSVFPFPVPRARCSTVSRAGFRGAIARSSLKLIVEINH